MAVAVDRLRNLKQKITDQRAHLDELEGHMYVLPSPDLYVDIFDRSSLIGHAHIAEIRANPSLVIS